MDDHVERPVSDETPPAPGLEWRSFAAGCLAVRAGLLIELAAIGGALVTLAAPLARAVFLGRWLGGGAELFGLSGPRLWVPFAAVLFLGAAVTAFGRVRMAAVPADTGARGVLFLTSLLAIVRAIALGVGVAFLWVGGDVEAGDWRRTAGDLAPWVFGAAYTAGGLADLAVLVGMALVAGAIPSRRLRLTTGRVAGFVLSLAVALWPLGLTALFFIRMQQRERRASPLPTPWELLDMDLGWWLVTAFLAAIGLLAFEFVYTWMQYRLYSAARAAVRPEPTD